MLSVISFEYVIVNVTDSSTLTKPLPNLSKVIVKVSLTIYVLLSDWTSPYLAWILYEPATSPTLNLNVLDSLKLIWPILTLLSLKISTMPVSTTLPLFVILTVTVRLVFLVQLYKCQELRWSHSP